MSEGTRAVALSEAVKVLAGQEAVDAATVIAYAESFNNYLNADTATVLTPAAEKPKAEKPKAEKPAKPVKAAQESPKQEAKPVPTVSVDDIGKAIASLLEAQKRTELKALLSKYGAQNKSTLQEDDYEAFLSEAKGLLEESDPSA
jgi:pyruvate/2-oxoglutarate dehydrogenase complex dihydrolipoamide acyltransferase (E2) component